MKIEEMELYIKDKCSLHPKMSLLMWKEEENKKKGNVKKIIDVIKKEERNVRTKRGRNRRGARTNEGRYDGLERSNGFHDGGHVKHEENDGKQCGRSFRHQRRRSGKACPSVYHKSSTSTRPRHGGTRRRGVGQHRWSTHGV